MNHRRPDPFHDEVESEGSWAVSYGDMITLLLTFFILFFNIDRSTQSKRLALQDSLYEKISESGRHPALTLGKESNAETIDNAAMTAWGARLSKVGDKLIVEFPEVSFFEKGSTEVVVSAQKKLVRFAKLYEQYIGNNALSVKAYTDSTQVMDGHRYRDNLELSALRSLSAMRILQKAGIPLSYMRISGNGETQSITRKISQVSPTVGHSAQRGDPYARKILLIIEPINQEKI